MPFTFTHISPLPPRVRGDPVVRRPDLGGAACLDGQQHDGEHRHGGVRDQPVSEPARRSTSTATTVNHDDRVRAGGGQDREAGDTEHRAGDVPGVRLSGGIDRSSGPSGIASVAISAATSANTSGSTRKLMSARCSRRARRTARRRTDLDVQLERRRSARPRPRAGSGTARPCRAAPRCRGGSRRRCPRKLAISRKFEKKPM